MGGPHYVCPTETLMEEIDSSLGDYRKSLRGPLLVRIAVLEDNLKELRASVKARDLLPRQDVVDLLNEARADGETDMRTILAQVSCLKAASS